MLSTPIANPGTFSADQTATAPTHGNLVRIEPLIPVVIFVVSTLYLLAFRHYSSLEPDEGIVLQGAERILRGQIPYRDFFSFYTPGSYYFIALCFRIFGDSFVLARTTLAVAGAVCSVITYLLARRACSIGMALFAAALATVAGTAYRFLVLHNWYSTLLCCLTVYATVKAIETHKNAWAFGAGSFASLTFLFEQSKGAGLWLGLVVGITILGLRRTARFRKFEIIACAAGLLWPFLLTLTYFYLHHSLAMMLADWFWPLRHYTQANRVPYGYQNWSDHSRDVIFHVGPIWTRAVKVLAISPGFVVPVLPLIAAGLLVYWSFVGCRRQTAETYSRYVLISAASTGLLVSVIVVRADIIHFMYLTPLWYVLLAWIFGSRELSSRALVMMRPYLTMFVAVAFGLMAMAVLLTALGARFRTETRRGLITTGTPDTVLEFMQTHTQPGDTILVYPYLPLYYYLMATDSPSRYDYLQPGMNDPQQFQETIRSLGSEHINAVLVEPWFAEKIVTSWPGTPLEAVARDPVAVYIARNYRVCHILSSASRWRFEYLLRRDVGCQ